MGRDGMWWDSVRWEDMRSETSRGIPICPDLMKFNCVHYYLWAPAVVVLCTMLCAGQCPVLSLSARVCPCVRPSSLMSIRSNRRIQRRISRFAFKGIIIKKSSFSLPRCGESNKNADDDELDWLMWTMMMMVKKGNHPLWRNATLMNTRQRRNRLLILEIIPNYD